jgi:diadenosine tetraphosphate (Ap4A) HIT family hydrolase
MPEFLLDPQIAADSTALAHLPLSELRLMKDARFRWVILVPRVAGAVEIVDLAKPDRAALFEEINAVSAALRAATHCHKLNVAAIGNYVRQLHVHVVARFTTDAAWPKPVWGWPGDVVAYDPAERDRLAADIRTHLSPQFP